jgi:hypothetical protein
MGQLAKNGHLGDDPAVPGRQLFRARTISHIGTSGESSLETS